MSRISPDPSTPAAQARWSICTGLDEKLAAARRNGVICVEDASGGRYWFRRFTSWAVGPLRDGKDFFGIYNPPATS